MSNEDDRTQNSLAAIQTLLSFAAVITFCGYLSGYGYYNAVLSHFFKTTAPITHFMEWDTLIVQGIVVVVRQLAIGIVFGIGFYFWRLRKRQLQSLQAFTSEAVQFSVFGGFILILVGFHLFRRLMFPVILKAPIFEALFYWCTNVLTGAVVSLLIYYVAGTFVLADNVLQRIAAGLYATALAVVLFFVVSSTIGEFESDLFGSGKRKLPYPEITLVVENEISGLKKNAATQDVAYKLLLFSRLSDVLYVVNLESNTLHAVPYDSVKTFWFSRQDSDKKR